MKACLEGTQRKLEIIENMVVQDEEILEVYRTSWCI